MITTENNGITYLLDGFKLIFKPKIRRFVFIPLLINILLFCGLLFTFIHFFSTANQWMMSHLPSWLHWLSGVLWVLFFLSFSTVMVYTFVTLVNIISAPFNGLLAEQVELHLTGQKPINSHFFKDSVLSIKRQFTILGFYLPRAALLLLLFFVPLLQVLAAPIWFIFNAWFMALQCIDYPTDNHKIPFAEVRAKLEARKFLVLTFGISVLVISMVPIVNCLIIPAAVAGATKLWLTEF